ncbi:hypothetical protein L249_7672 [Ophiocordyceps polyrhachis-furcata BCC 54312]|uniref:Uncharacterized protein n=1 Tax=Ophiocordyceps polyrhachis-furcata BCC 54312 TaxID=1330021 RepID=A0A367LBE2_9HYPO|nr:hypothetical protein L249_7672 [Ophiocordyceps polyrhachis-furcata BCC 54312]
MGDDVLYDSPHLTHCGASKQRAGQQTAVCLSSLLPNRKAPFTTITTDATHSTKPPGPAQARDPLRRQFTRRNLDV